MEADREIKFNGHLPQRIPMQVAQQRLPEGLWRPCEQNPLMARGGAAPYFARRGSDIPEWRRSDWQQSARISRCPLRLPVVIGLHAGEHQFGIAQLQELLSAEPPHV